MANDRGIDLPRERRPGAPMEYAPKPAGNAHWARPEPMSSELAKLRPEPMELTPVFGTAVPPRGISGLMRKAAYKIPDHKPMHWMMLLMADRVDVIESSPVRSILAVGALAAIGFGVYFATRPRTTRGVLRFLF